MTVAHIVIPSWFGKALGAAAALVFAPTDPALLVWWLAAGIGLGHCLDGLSSQRTGKPGGQRPSATSRASLRFTFAALGRIAAASGIHAPEHYRYAERLMNRLAFTPERHRQALVWFHAGRDSAFPFDALAPACRQELAEHPVLGELASESMCRMAALADTPKATAELLSLGARLGWDRDRLARQAVTMAALTSDGDGLEQARTTLGVNANDTPATIRLAYRRRIARWHPDRLPAEVSAEERAAAEDRMCRLREALERLVGTPG